MNLSIISDDPVHAGVLAGVAERAGWSVTQSSSLAEAGAGSTPQADAVLVDIERLDEPTCAALQAFVRRLGATSVLLLTEDLSDTLPSADDLGIHFIAAKPVHPADVMRAIQASVSAASAQPSGRPLSTAP